MKCNSCLSDNESNSLFCISCSNEIRNHALELISKLPIEFMSQKALDSLPEYSLSNPSGTSIGKVWKRDLALGTIGGPIWVICEYVKSDDPKLLKIENRNYKVE